MQRRHFLGSLCSTLLASKLAGQAAPGSYRFVQEADMPSGKFPDFVDGVRPDMPGIPCLPADLSAIPSFKPPGGKPVLRRTWSELQNDTTYTNKLAAAYSKLVADDGPTGLLAQANVHATYCGGWWDPGGGSCRDGSRSGWDIHSNWYFLPWHRAFTYFHERTLGRIMGDPDFRLPVWDWNTPGNGRIPGFYSTLGMPSYFNSGLKRTNMDGTHYLDSCIQQAWLFGDFTKFCGSPAGTPHAQPPQAYSGPHTTIHQYVAGGAMADAQFAAGDPVFFSHHANIDRMWALWSERNSTPASAWSNTTPFVLYDEQGQLTKIDPRVLMEHTALGYDYDLASIKLDLSLAEDSVDLLQVGDQALTSAFALLKRAYASFDSWHNITDKLQQPKPLSAFTAAALPNDFVTKLMSGPLRDAELCVPCRIRMTATNTFKVNAYYLVRLESLPAVANLGGFGVFGHDMGGPREILIDAALPVAIVPTLLSWLRTGKINLTYGEASMASAGNGVGFQALTIPAGRLNFTFFDMLAA